MMGKTTAHSPSPIDMDGRLRVAILVRWTGETPDDAGLAGFRRDAARPAIRIVAGTQRLRLLHGTVGSADEFRALNRHPRVAAICLGPSAKGLQAATDIEEAIMTARLAMTRGEARAVAWQRLVPGHRGALASDGFSDPHLYTAYTDQFATGQNLLDTHFADWDFAEDDDAPPAGLTVDAIWARIDMIRDELVQLERAILDRPAVAA